MAVDDDDVAQALLGSEYFVVRWGLDGAKEAEERRKPDGAWFGPSGPRNTRVSAVLSTKGLSFWNLGEKRLTLWHHPRAARPLLGWPLDVDRYDPVGERMRRSAGRSIAELLDLPNGWPG